MEIDHSQLVLSWQNDRDQDAVNTLYSDLKPFIHYLLSRPFAKRRGIDSESVLNEVFTLALEHYKPGFSKFTTYLHKAFRNALISAERHLNNSKRKDFIAVDPENKQYLNTEQETVLSDQDRIELIKAIQHLPPKQLDAIQLYLEGNSWADISRQRGYAKSTMNNLMNDCLKNLRNIL